MSVTQTQPGAPSLSALLGDLRPLEPKLTAAIAELERLINEDWRAIIDAHPPAHAIELFKLLQRELAKLREHAHVPALTGRRIIGVGGAFSAGKSSFLNAIVGGRVLPTGLRPTTAVPTYVLPGLCDGIRVVNMFEESGVVSPEAFATLTHQGGHQAGFRIGRLLKGAYAHATCPRYHHLAFLDTPGYDKADGRAAGADADAAIARAELKAVDAIIWLADATRGLTAGDLEFLKSLETEAPLLVLLTRADKVRADELPHIVSQAQADVKVAGLKPVAVLPFSLRHEGHERATIHHWLAYWEDRHQREAPDDPFLTALQACKAYYESTRTSQQSILQAATGAGMDATDPLTRELFVGVGARAVETINACLASATALSGLIGEVRAELKAYHSLVADAAPWPNTTITVAKDPEPKTTNKKAKKKKSRPTRPEAGELVARVPAAHRGTQSTHRQRSHRR